MAKHIPFDFHRDGFTRTVPDRYSDAARLLDAVVRPHASRLIINRCSVRNFGGRQDATQFCHLADLSCDPTVQIADFQVNGNRALFALYCAHVLCEDLWRGAADTGTDNPRPLFYILQEGEQARHGCLTVGEAIERLGMALADAEAANAAGRLKVRWVGEGVAHRVLDHLDGAWHPQASPSWLHCGSSKPRFDFLDTTPKLGAVEVMGTQHFTPVERFGGDASKAGSNERTRLKVRACRERYVPLLFMRWHSGSILNRIYREKDGIRRIADLAASAFARSRASDCRWIDLDEHVIQSRSGEYDFLRNFGLPSASDTHA